MHIYRINVIFNHDEDLQTEGKIESKLGEIVDKYGGELVSTSVDTLEGCNFGRCSKCGCWTSDATKEDFISGLSNGAQINGIWFCDLCLPVDHPNSF